MTEVVVSKLLISLATRFEVVADQKNQIVFCRIWSADKVQNEVQDRGDGTEVHLSTWRHHSVLQVSPDIDQWYQDREDQGGSSSKCKSSPAGKIAGRKSSDFFFLTHLCMHRDNISNIFLWLGKYIPQLTHTAMFSKDHINLCTLSQRKIVTRAICCSKAKKCPVNKVQKPRLV